METKKAKDNVINDLVILREETEAVDGKPIQNQTPSTELT